MFTNLISKASQKMNPYVNTQSEPMGTDGQTDKRTDKWTNGRTNGQTDGQTDKRTDGQIFAHYSGISSHSLRGVRILCMFLFCIFLLYHADPQVEVQIRILLKD